MITTLIFSFWKLSAVTYVREPIIRFNKKAWITTPEGGCMLLLNIMKRTRASNMLAKIYGQHVQHIWHTSSTASISLKWPWRKSGTNCVRNSSRTKSRVPGAQKLHLHFFWTCFPSTWSFKEHLTLMKSWGGGDLNFHITHFLSLYYLRPFCIKRMEKLCGQIGAGISPSVITPKMGIYDM